MTDRDRSERRVEELVHTEPTVDRTPVQKMLRMLSVLCAVVALAAAGVLVIAYAQLRACTNSNLTAQATFAKSVRTFTNSVIEVFDKQPGTNAQQRALIALKVDSERLRDASRIWQTTTTTGHC